MVFFSYPAVAFLDGGSLDDGLVLFVDYLVGAEDGFPDDGAENSAKKGADPEHPEVDSVVV